MPFSPFVQQSSVLHASHRVSPSIPGFPATSVSTSSHTISYPPSASKPRSPTTLMREVSLNPQDAAMTADTKHLMLNWRGSGPTGKESPGRFNPYVNVNQNDQPHLTSHPISLRPLSPKLLSSGIVDEDYPLIFGGIVGTEVLDLRDTPIAVSVERFHPNSSIPLDPDPLATLGLAGGLLPGKSADSCSSLRWAWIRWTTPHAEFIWTGSLEDAVDDFASKAFEPDTVVPHVIEGETYYALDYSVLLDIAHIVLALSQILVALHHFTTNGQGRGFMLDPQYKFLRILARHPNTNGIFAALSTLQKRSKSACKYIKSTFDSIRSTYAEQLDKLRTTGLGLTIDTTNVMTPATESSMSLQYPESVQPSPTLGPSNMNIATHGLIQREKAEKESSQAGSRPNTDSNVLSSTAIPKESQTLRHPLPPKPAFPVEDGQSVMSAFPHAVETAVADRSAVGLPSDHSRMSVSPKVAPLTQLPGINPASLSTISRENELRAALRGGVRERYDGGGGGRQRGRGRKTSGRGGPGHHAAVTTRHQPKAQSSPVSAPALLPAATNVTPPTSIPQPSDVLQPAGASQPANVSQPSSVSQSPRQANSPYLSAPMHSSEESAMKVDSGAHGAQSPPAEHMDIDAPGPSTNTNSAEQPQLELSTTPFLRIYVHDRSTDPWRFRVFLLQTVKMMGPGPKRMTQVFLKGLLHYSMDLVSAEQSTAVREWFTKGHLTSNYSADVITEQEFEQDWLDADVRYPDSYEDVSATSELSNVQTSTSPSPPVQALPKAPSPSAVRPNPPRGHSPPRRPRSRSARPAPSPPPVRRMSSRSRSPPPRRDRSPFRRRLSPPPRSLPARSLPPRRPRTPSPLPPRAPLAKRPAFNVNQPNKRPAITAEMGKQSPSGIELPRKPIDTLDQLRKSATAMMKMQQSKTPSPVEEQPKKPSPAVHQSKRPSPVREQPRKSPVAVGPPEQRPVTNKPAFTPQLPIEVAQPLPKPARSQPLSMRLDPAPPPSSGAEMFSSLPPQPAMQSLSMRLQQPTLAERLSSTVYYGGDHYSPPPSPPRFKPRKNYKPMK